MKDGPQPGPRDTAALQAKLAAAESAVPAVRNSNGYPVYPEQINEFTKFITLSPWHDSGYSRFQIQEIFVQPQLFGAEEIAAALTCLTRLERFSPGSLKARLEDGTARRLVTRAVELAAG